MQINFNIIEFNTYPRIAEDVLDPAFVDSLRESM